MKKREEESEKLNAGSKGNRAEKTGKGQDTPRYLRLDLLAKS